MEKVTDPDLSDLEKKIEWLRSDFQELEKLFHAVREILEEKIELLTEDVKNASRRE